MPPKRRYISLGDIINIRLPRSEACIRLKIARKVMDVWIIRRGVLMAQPLSPDGSQFGPPIAMADAGFTYDVEQERYYIE